MNNNEILNKYIDLIDKGYCCDCNELNCIDNFPQAKITHAIRKLQQENKILKENWNKLKDYIVKEYYMYLPLEASTRSITILIDKMQELEGSDSNE